MTANLFRYPDERWRRMEEIVQRAGGDVARDRFNTQRATVEKMAGGWKDRIETWNGYNFGQADAPTYQRIERAAHELNAALAELGFPALFIRNDLVWKHLAETHENQARFANFGQAIEHVAAYAERMAAPRRKQARLPRDMFIADLGRVWRVELGLRISASAASRFAKFVEAASEGVCELPDKKPRVTISGVIRKWPRRGGA